MLLDEVSYAHKVNLTNTAIVWANPDVSLPGLAADFSRLVHAARIYRYSGRWVARCASLSDSLPKVPLVRYCVMSTFMLDKHAKRWQLSRGPQGPSGGRPLTSVSC